MAATETVGAVRDQARQLGGRIDSTLDTSADRLRSSPVGALIMLVSVAFGFLFASAAALNATTADPSTVLFGLAVGLLLFLNGFMHIWGADR